MHACMQGPLNNKLKQESKKSFGDNQVMFCTVEFTGEFPMSQQFLNGSVDQHLCKAAGEQYMRLRQFDDGTMDRVVGILGVDPLPDSVPSQAMWHILVKARIRALVVRLKVGDFVDMFVESIQRYGCHLSAGSASGFLLERFLGAQQVTFGNDPRPFFRLGRKNGEDDVIEEGSLLRTKISRVGLNSERNNLFLVVGMNVTGTGVWATSSSSAAKAAT